MLSKNEVKYIQSLYHKKTRESEGVFVVEGPKMVTELLQSGYVVKKIYATSEWAKPKNANVEIVDITDADLERISALQAPHQVLAIAEQRTLIEEPMLKGNLTLALDNIQDPGNLGTIIRIADWFGIKQVIASENTVELYNPKVIQSTMGSFMRVDVWYRNLNSLLPDAGVPVYGAVLNGKNVFSIGRVKEGILLIGNESRGIGEELMQLVTDPLTIPRFGGAESLNAAVATGIILSHIRVSNL